jgi:hypothetical protein
MTPVKSVATDIVSAPTVAAVPASPIPPPVPAVTPAPAEDLSFGYREDIKQIALRAIFNTENTLAPQEVVDLSSRFEGIRACLVITDLGVTHSGRAENSEEVRNFSINSVEAYRNLTALAASLGMNQQGTFTLRSDQAVRSFFLEKGICLAVLHSEPAFRPGVRERLILVAQELSQMLA